MKTLDRKFQESFCSYYFEAIDLALCIGHMYKKFMRAYFKYYIIVLFFYLSENSLDVSETNGFTCVHDRSLHVLHMLVEIKVLLMTIGL